MLQPNIATYSNYFISELVVLFVYLHQPSEQTSLDATYLRGKSTVWDEPINYNEWERELGECICPS